ncbi:MAG: type II toxin-antitoxin system HicA family toxin [Dehalococcoidia bacterium]
MTHGELTRKLRRLGIVFRRQASGSHEMWRNPANNRYTIIPRTTKDIRKGTLAKIMKDIGLRLEDLEGV